MTWPILIIATLSSVLVAIACFALGVRKLAVVLPAQVVVAFAAAYGVTLGFAEEAVEPRAVWTCLGAAVAIPAIWSVLKMIMGNPLERRRSERAGGARPIE